MRDPQNRARLAWSRRLPAHLACDSHQCFDELSVVGRLLAIGEVEGVFQAGAHVSAEFDAGAVQLPDLLAPRAGGDHLPVGVLGEFVRERKLLRLEEAVRRMTSASAERFGLGDRGVLAQGKAAEHLRAGRTNLRLLMAPQVKAPLGTRRPASTLKGEHICFFWGVRSASHVGYCHTIQVARTPFALYSQHSNVDPFPQHVGQS